MNAKDIIRATINMGHFICNGYLADLSDADLMLRAAPGVNHINWQLGHLIAAEHHYGNMVSGGKMPPLPAGFAEKYGKDAAANDDPAAFCTKEELLRVAAEQRAVTLATLEAISDADLDNQTGIPYCPTQGEQLAMQGTHWLMHCGQWAVVRRQLGKPPLF
ncbi:DinB family protein [Anatilimnocola floriformis]|uniref:DinB family protein n=1 Tax=Anatilimnocola floriformis TaxID=2948575 RepID=UPI0020C585CF|nr:DinB family protein [Anatilimnocola floriformis]